MKYGLKDEHFDAILGVLRRHPRVEKAVLFGSRAMGTYTLESDVDLCLFGDAIDLTEHARILAEMEALTVPQRVDLLVHHAIKEQALLEHIARQGRPLFITAGKDQSRRVL